ncbi:MAG: HAMP domain-containing histidine kinase [Oscillospiraceae bacterium]|nr:HAMP domain-containing histidine kinase [Oscillospiraceae bacterium]
MKNLQKIRALKALAVVLALVCTFSAGFCTLSAVLIWYNSAQYSDAESTYIYRQLEADYAAMAWQLYLRENYPGDTVQEQYQSQQIVETLTETLEDSGYCYQIVNSATGEVVGLSEGLDESALTDTDSPGTLSYFYEAAYTYSLYEHPWISLMDGSWWTEWDGTTSEEAMEETTVTEWTTEADNPACYYRLEDDFTLTALGLGKGSAMDAALEDERLYVLLDSSDEYTLYKVTGYGYTMIGNEEYSYVIQSCEFDENDWIETEESMVFGPLSADSATLYVRTDSGSTVGTLTKFEGSQEDLGYQLSAGNVYVRDTVSDTGLVFRVDSARVIDEETGEIYVTYTRYRDAVVSTYVTSGYVTSESDTSVLDSEASLLAEDTDTYYLMHGVVSVDGVITDFDQVEQLYSQCKGWFPLLTVLAVLSVLLVLASVVWLWISAGHSCRGREQEIALNRFDRFWVEALLFLWVCGMVLLWAFFVDYLQYRFVDFDELSYSVQTFRNGLAWNGCLLGGVLLAAMALSLPLLLTIVRRGKAHALWDTTLLHILWRYLARFLRWLGKWGKNLWGLLRQNVPLTVGASFAYLVFMFFVLRSIMGYFIMMLLLIAAGLVVVVAWTIDFWVIRQGVKRLNQGETDTKINVRGMLPDMRELAEELNNLSVGIQKAVEKQMQSERFKAELITNVSHDLKTPLTSIINYVDLLKKTDITDPTALEYLEVLDRKSQRLKKLTEDLVEASKASTGAMRVDKKELDLCQLVSQALAEYEEKLARSSLKLVVKMPEPPVTVLADRQHLWRVLDNLLNNCTKYALPGTRIYVNLEKRAGNAIIELKNISAEPLNLTADELMERFVRGDSSRSTEGSGLGLNISMSLMNLMGGEFQISVDGDLFKVTLTMPIVQLAPKKGNYADETV